MRALLCALVGLCAAFKPPFADFDSRLGYNPVAAKDATVSIGCARFTVLTSHVVRMEWDASATFEDRPTFAMVNRKLAVPQNLTSHYDASTHVFTLSTSELTLEYATPQTCDPSNPSAFSAETLVVRSINPAAQWTYHYGDDIYSTGGSLFGTIRSLDNIVSPPLNCDDLRGKKVHDEELHCFPGVASTSGWTVVNDTANYILPNQDGEWFSPDLRSSSDIDIYFFGHNFDILAAYAALAAISGAPQPPPRSSMGVMRSRWYDDNEGDVVDEVTNGFAAHGVPVDWYILDMDWHTKPNWGGYQWDERLFPKDGRKLRGRLGRYPLRLMVNVHDDDGVRSSEPYYAKFCEAVKADECNRNATVPFSVVSQSYMRALDDVMWAQQVGADALWIDWQQGGALGGATGGRFNPTILLNHLRFTSPTRSPKLFGGRRGMVLARWGGLGSQRYPVGFSGDVGALSWEALAYQPFFTSTAGNALYAWSHDTVGPRDNPELYARWIQSNSVSAVMRMHDRGASAGGCAANPYLTSCATVWPWQVPQPFGEAARMALRERSSMVPYIATAWWRAATVGTPVVSPRYAVPQFDTHHLGYSPCSSTPSPSDACAYFFGGSLLVAPVVWGSKDGVSNQTVFLPPDSQWVDVTTGSNAHNGDGSVSRRYTIFETPTFAKAGSVVPATPMPLCGLAVVGTASSLPEIVEVRAYFASNTTTAEGSMVEYDDASTDYLAGAVVQTTFSVSIPSAATDSVAPQPAMLEVRVNAGPKGMPSGFPTGRRYLVRVDFPIPPTEVAAFSPFGCLGSAYGHTFEAPADNHCVYFDMETLSTYVLTPVQLNGTIELPISPPSGVSFEELRTLRAVMRCAQVTKRVLDEARFTPGSQSAEFSSFLRLASMSQRIADEEVSVLYAVKEASNIYRAAVSEVYAANKKNQDTAAFYFGSTIMSECLL